MAEVEVNLDDDLIAFADDQVESGEAPDRSAVVETAMHRYRKRRRALRDAEIIKRQGSDTDDDGLREIVQWASQRPFFVDY